MDVLSFIIVSICGLGIGILSGMFGIGGGGLVVPLLHVVFGLPMTAATATSLLTIAPTGISGSIKHILQKTISLRIGLLMGGMGAVACVISSLFAESIPAYVVVVLTVLVILFSVGMMVRTMIVDSRRSTTVDEAKRKENTIPRRRAVYTVILPLIIGVIAGAVAGIVGVGGGFIIVPFCVAYLGFSLKKAAGTSLVAISLISVPGIVSHTLLGHIWWIYGIAIMVGTIPGAQLGAWLIDRLPERPMRIAFAILLTFVGLIMLAQEFFL